MVPTKVPTFVLHMSHHGSRKRGRGGSGGRSSNSTPFTRTGPRGEHSRNFLNVGRSCNILTPAKWATDSRLASFSKVVLLILLNVGPALSGGGRRSRKSISSYVQVPPHRLAFISQTACGNPNEFMMAPDRGMKNVSIRNTDGHAQGSFRDTCAERT